jgi:4-aminobutyrate aminotransferase-like enzyme
VGYNRLSDVPLSTLASERSNCGRIAFTSTEVCAAALASIETLEQENVAARATEIGEMFELRANEWKKRWPRLGEIRGLGAMRAIELVRTLLHLKPHAILSFLSRLF